MKERIIQIMKSSAMTNIFDSSVIFENRFTGVVKMYNGLSEEFEMVPRDVFNELLADGIMKKYMKKQLKDILTHWKSMSLQG